jgi:hypothetical protein
MPMADTASAHNIRERPAVCSSAMAHGSGAGSSADIPETRPMRSPAHRLSARIAAIDPGHGAKVWLL